MKLQLLKMLSMASGMMPGAVDAELLTRLHCGLQWKAMVCTCSLRNQPPLRLSIVLTLEPSGRLKVRCVWACAPVAMSDAANAAAMTRNFMPVSFCGWGHPRAVAKR
jgi:hypothetical protein